MSTEIKKEEVFSELARPRLSDLWKTEDCWAIWIGFFLIIIGLIIFLPNPPENLKQKLADANSKLKSEPVPFYSLDWYKASDAKMALRASREEYAKTIKRWTHKPYVWKNNPLEAFLLTSEQAKNRKSKMKIEYLQLIERENELQSLAETAESLARSAQLSNPELNRQAKRSITEYRSAHRKTLSAKKKTQIKTYNHIGHLIFLGLFMGLLFSIGIKFMNEPASEFLKGFTTVYGLAVLANVFAAQADVKSAGIGYAAWAILLGLLVSNTLGTARWVQPAMKMEFFIKTGLVLLGAEILFGKILIIGLPGIFVAWIVTPMVLLATYWFGQRVLRIESKTLNITICADMSVCGVSAAIATAAACKAKKEELTLAVGLSMAFTSVMMIILPNIILALKMEHVLGGAWIGGTIDATGAVAAAGAFLGERALYVAATVKMIQNILIGVIAFGVAVYWTTRVERNRGNSRPNVMEIWRHFPKFLLGFVAASLLFSLIYEIMGRDIGEAMLTQGVITGWTKIWRGWFFSLAFVSIGLATDFRKLGHYFKGGKALMLYVCGQTLNLLLTLAMAYLMFYVVFPETTSRLGS